MENKDDNLKKKNERIGFEFSLISFLKLGYYFIFIYPTNSWLEKYVLINQKVRKQDASVGIHCRMTFNVVP